MTIIHVPCYLFIYDGFTKEMISSIIQMEGNATLVSNFDQVGKNCYMGVTEADCQAKITEWELIIPEE